MNTVRRLVVLGFAVLFLTAACVPLFAQYDQSPVEESTASPSANSTAPDPPSRAARLDYVSGSISIQPGGVNDWVEASINRTLTTSDRIWADKNSRAELQLDTAAIRINSETSVTLTNVSDTSTQIELDQGTMYLSVMRLFPGQIYEVDTPNVAFTVLKPGRYHFDVDSNGDNTRVLVHRGEGEATGDGPSVRIHEREGARFSGGRSMANNVFEDPGYDGFDDWAANRDERQEKSVSARYVAPGVVGYEDLDSYGYWRSIAPYGPVWVPTAVAPGWAPYRFGHWVWVSPWGWTWVDDAPWGYAPFHYGRWAYIHGYWGWVPGPVYVRPVWAPALVAWVGGAHWGVSFGVGGGYGWFPLGWREPFVPWYGGSRHYFRNVNVSNTNITNITYVTNNYYNNPRNVSRITYVNRTVPGAMTAVPASTLVNGRSVQTTAVRVNPNQLRDARVTTRPDVRPTTAAVLGPHAGVRTAAPPSAAINRPVVTKMTPPATSRQPMNIQRGGMTETNRPGLNAGKAGINGNGQAGVNVARPEMNTAARPNTPATNPNNIGNRPDMVNNTRPEFPTNVHRPPSTGGNVPNVKPTGGATAAPANENVARPAGSNTGNTTGQFNRGGPANNGINNRNVQVNPNVPRPGETVARPNTGISPRNTTPNNGMNNRNVQVNPNVPRPGETVARPNTSMPPGNSTPRPATNVQQMPKSEPAVINNQPRGNINNNVPRPVPQGSGNPNAGVNTRVNESSGPGGRSYPQGNSGGNRVSQPGSSSGGQSSQQPRGNQRPTQKNNDQPKGKPQGYLSPARSSSTMSARAGNSYSYPRPQAGPIRQPQSSASQSVAYGRSARTIYRSSSNGSYVGNGGYRQYSNPQYSNRASSNGPRNTGGYATPATSSAGLYSRGGSTGGGSYSRTQSSGSYSRGGSTSRSSGASGHAGGGGHSHGR